MSQIDRKTFRWYKRKDDFSEIYEPVVWRYGEKMYQLNYFDNISNQFILKDSYGKIDALNFSLEFYRAEEVTLSQLASIYKICKTFAINPSDIKIFEKNGIKGDDAYESLEYYDKLNELTAEYINIKKLGIKYISILKKLKENHLKIIDQFIDKKKPSASDLRNFINFIKDYKNYINNDTFDENLINSIRKKRNLLQSDFQEKFKELQKNFHSITVDNINNFEKCSLKVISEISNMEDYFASLREFQKKEIFEEIFNLMKRYDIY